MVEPKVSQAELPQRTSRLRSAARRPDPERRAPLAARCGALRRSAAAPIRSARALRL